ncbi:hypothetical protein AC579_10342 [Pseudocercospora musae]|uniref:Uncharacterized protein n=1 Tax=Pseudocercospora musae TaxID=113226 RepID=A0A139ICT2_9PEZI|nr:hypothetical protein AC579_10342 [Pseudocercospora musae]KXT12505.1 hypothetical protein AC579_10342 [Pseudocercospora musae]KXT12506.1 hypothetical protein AC579_10342 [Pseudocercospora musae]
MLKVTIFSYLGTLCSATVIPTCKSFTETFDTLQPNPLGEVLPILNQVGTGTYKNLNYGTAVLTPFENSLLPPITPKSPNNTAVIGVGLTLIGGLPTGSVGITPQSTIKPAGTTKSFDLDSLYIACGLNAMNSLVGVRTACGVTITGKDINGNDLPSQTLEWGPDELVGSSMEYWKLDGIVKAKEVTIKITSSLSQTLTIVFLDNVKYCVRT